MIRLGISIGDVNGIGLEVILKTFADDRMLSHCTPVIYGSTKVLAYHKNIVKDLNISFQTVVDAGRLVEGKINVINCWHEAINITLGELTEESGKYAVLSLDKMTRDLRDGLLDVIVTGPVNKKALELAQFPYIGHTDYLQDVFGGESLMLMVQDNLRVAMVTNHLPLAQVAESITKEKLTAKLITFDESLKKDFGIDRPNIAVMGLNPHAGDEGAIGDEEKTIIRPVIENLKEHGIMAFGPFPGDGFFGSGAFKKYDGIMAMYHDQGLIPFKTLSFGGGINFTAGLSAIRTSPDHGTAFDIAGQGIADASSFRQAVFLAIDIYKKRQDWDDMNRTPLKKKPKPSEELNE